MSEIIIPKVPDTYYEARALAKKIDACKNHRESWSKPVSDFADINNKPIIMYRIKGKEKLYPNINKLAMEEGVDYSRIIDALNHKYKLRTSGHEFETVEVLNGKIISVK